MKSFFGLVLLVFSPMVSAQISGIVKDSISSAPISYVHISVENENLGTSTEEDGRFTLRVDENKILVFSALGYQTKKCKAAQATEIRLKPVSYALDEIVIAKRLETREREIGKTSTQAYQAFDRGPSIDAKFFPYDVSYKKTKFLKQVVVVTDSKIDGAVFKIHFYSVGDDGLPGQELLNKDFIVSVGQGVKQTKLNLSKLNLKMPKDGIFVGFEKLLIEKNKWEKTSIDPNTQQTQTQKAYYPFLLYNAVDSQPTFAFSGGKWVRQNPKETDTSTTMPQVLEPVIFLVLSN
ncbi:carboxypeptidase-like regulatory domain-containing protein [Flavobacterium sp. CYK-4]|uniref:carboxypeptidase-like regulatory domain-containing protein n=1 Tax=Flavobacterium lotistagni TaxID=2709660 RepID=UPI00140BF342|nr:carboxypeptidase-like regulatory domain-containing protein [Flavobacterium lotistagni]NHM06139.1 carboxypeptidase-like regulatory domain-containing protein [Flavobacterium lotistagni]